MKLLIGSVSLVVFACLNLVVSETLFATLEATKSKDHLTTESGIWISKQYYKLNKGTLFLKCKKNKMGQIFDIGDDLVHLKMNCNEIAMVSNFKENGWQVEHGGSYFDSQSGDRISNWYFKKDEDNVYQLY